MSNSDNNSKLVYSTAFGKMCPSCGDQSAKCKCKKRVINIPKGDGNFRVERSVKGRKGKGVSLISGLPLESAELKGLAKKLKQKCGTVKNGKIEIQGDHRDLLIEELNKLGYQTKKAGE